jgi:hypothetical protein
MIYHIIMCVPYDQCWVGISKKMKSSRGFKSILTFKTIKYHPWWYIYMRLSLLVLNKMGTKNPLATSPFREKSKFWYLSTISKGSMVKFYKVKKINLRFKVALRNSCLCGTFFYMNIKHLHFPRCFTFFYVVDLLLFVWCYYLLSESSKGKRILCSFFFSLFASL